jgi:hypothetical protein
VLLAITHYCVQVIEVSFLFILWFCSWTSQASTWALSQRAEELVYKNENCLAAWFISLSIVFSNSIRVICTKQSWIVCFRTRRKKDLQYRYHNEIGVARIIKTWTPWTPSPWKASLCLLILWNQEASCCWQPEPQICLGDIWQTKKLEPSVTWYFPSHPWDKPALPPC